METFPEQIERLEHEPRLPAPEVHPALAEHATARVDADPSRKLAEARTSVETNVANEEPDLLEKLRQADEHEETNQARHVNRELKEVTMRRELSHIRRKLAAPERAFSKFIHNPSVRFASEAAGKTVSRPSGLLGGGLVAFLGTTSYLYLASHIGFTYQNSVFLLLFVAGFNVGLFLELVVHLATRSHRQAD